MPEIPAAPPHEPFDTLRPRLFGIAYRMLGVRADAEDVLQDAWLRWSAAELASDLSVAFLHMLERLAPEERAAFLLRQVFDYDYGEIASILDRSESAVRQVVHRAAERVRQERPRFAVPPETHRRLLEKFVQAAQSGQRAAIRALLADNAEAIGDGGGKVPSVPGGIHGADRVTNLYWAHHLRLGQQLEYRMAIINGEPGFLRYVEGRLESAQTVVTDGERIVAIYVVRNPDKLAHIAVPVTNPGAAAS